jgi:hypothetical protein
VDPATVTPPPPTEAEAAIAIAAIQAQAAVTINAQNNEAAIEIAETHAETDQNRIESNTECLSLQEQLAQARARIVELETLQASPSPVSSQEVAETIAEEVVAEIATDLTPLSTSQETVETQTEAIEKSEDERQEVELVALPGRKPLVLLV